MNWIQRCFIARNPASAMMQCMSFIIERERILNVIIAIWVTNLFEQAMEGIGWKKSVSFRGQGRQIPYYLINIAQRANHSALYKGQMSKFGKHTPVKFRRCAQVANKGNSAWTSIFSSLGSLCTPKLGYILVILITCKSIFQSLWMKVLTEIKGPFDMKLQCGRLMHWKITSTQHKRTLFLLMNSLPHAHRSPCCASERMRGLLWELCCSFNPRPVDTASRTHDLTSHHLIIPVLKNWTTGALSFL